jgi:hypothetical protein
MFDENEKKRGTKNTCSVGGSWTLDLGLGLSFFSMA